MGPLIDLLPLPYTDAVVLCGAVLLGCAAGVLGTFAVLRRRALVGDALAHAALPGVALAFLVTGTKDPSTLLVGAAIAGGLGALAMLGLERTPRLKPDAAAGVVLSSSFALGIVLLTAIAGANDSDQAGLDSYLFGQAAGLLERDVEVMAVLALAALAAVAIGFRPLKTTLFDPTFAGTTGLPVRALELAMTGLLVVAVVIGLRTVGAILMVALLVAPAVAARQVTSGLAAMLVVAGAVGGAAGGAGALISARGELPAGPVIVLLAVAVAIAAVLLAPGRGVLWGLGRLRAERRRALRDALLVDLDAAGGRASAGTLAAGGGRPERLVRRGLGRLARGGLVAREGEVHALTERGRSAVTEVGERHALWDAWLEHGWRLELGDAREPDPHDVRATLGDGLTDALEGRAQA